MDAWPFFIGLALSQSVAGTVRALEHMLHAKKKWISLSSNRQRERSKEQPASEERTCHVTRAEAAVLNPMDVAYLAHTY